MSTKITVNNNGSLKIEGEFEIVDKDGKNYGLAGRTVLSLCRCGRSQNKPFCDGSHKGHFEHDAVAFELPPHQAHLRRREDLRLLVGHLLGGLRVERRRRDVVRQRRARRRDRRER